MAHSRKRRSSMSPTRNQSSPDSPEHKKRKPNEISSTTNGASSSSKAATTCHPVVAHSPEPPGSDSSTTLDGDTPPSKDKGKGKAVEKDPLLLELEQLRKEVAHKNEILEKREKTVAAVTQTLTCQICLELMHKPYALAPCGHVSCHACLVSWFTAPHEGDEDDPDLEWYSDSDDSSSADGHDVPIPWPGSDAPANGHAPGNNPNPVNGNDEGNAIPLANGGPAPLENGNPAHPPLPEHVHAPYPSAIRRRKTCPHCRCIVKQRPVQVYLIKDLVGIVDSSPADLSKDEDTNETKKDKKGKVKDPWKGIFRRPKPPGPRHGHGPDNGHGHGHGHGGGHRWSDDSSDDESGGWPGLGSGGAAQFFFDDDDNNEDEDEEVHMPSLSGIHYHPRHHQHVHHPNSDSDGDPPLPPAFVDEEDGVRRCGRCMHELWGSECSNAECGAVYGGSSEGSDAGGPPPGHGGYDDGEGSDGDAEVDWASRDPQFDGLHPDDDGYESSFIDDGERGDRDRSVQATGEAWGTAQGADEDPEDDFIPGPSRRWARVQEETIVISSDEDEPGPSTRIQRGRRRIVDEDEEQEVEAGVSSIDEGVSSIDEGILALDPYPTFIHHHGPGSNTSSSLPGTDAHSSGHGVNADDDEDDYGGDEYVPYVWEEEDDDGPDHAYDQDNVVYLGENGQSEDDGDEYAF